jgi:hypothetical protein
MIQYFTLYLNLLAKINHPNLGTPFSFTVSWPGFVKSLKAFKSFKSQAELAPTGIR